MSEKTHSFEKAYERLEEILEKMHGETVSLDQALKLYEEADKLVSTCQKRLNDAEKKIEILLKNRDGSPKLDADQTPQTEPFTPSQRAALQQ